MICQIKPCFLVGSIFNILDTFSTSITVEEVDMSLTIGLRRYVLVGQHTSQILGKRSEGEAMSATNRTNDVYPFRIGNWVKIPPPSLLTMIKITGILERAISRRVQIIQGGRSPKHSDSSARSSRNHKQLPEVHQFPHPSVYDNPTEMPSQKWLLAACFEWTCCKKVSDRKNQLISNRKLR